MIDLTILDENWTKNIFLPIINFLYNK